MFPFSSICNPFFDSVSISVLCAAFCESTIPLFIAIPVSPTAFPSESTFLTSTVNLTGFITLTNTVSIPSFVVITGSSTYEYTESFDPTAVPSLLHMFHDVTCGFPSSVILTFTDTYLPSSTFTYFSFVVSFSSILYSYEEIGKSFSFNSTLSETAFLDHKIFAFELASTLVIVNWFLVNVVSPVSFNTVSTL